jgi:tetratricopeptide (TPR) repeat protein
VPFNFKITRGAHPKGRFIPSDPRKWRRFEEKYLAGNSKLHSGEISGEKLALERERDLEKDPDNIYAAFALSALWRQRGERQALASALDETLSPIIRLVPPDFQGELDALDPPTVIFLACHYALLRCRVALGDFGAIRTLARDHDRWDKLNRHGSLETLANASLLAGQAEMEADYFRSDPARAEPLALYGQALYRFARGEHSLAMERLRQAILSDPFVAELLLGRSPLSLKAWGFPRAAGLCAEAGLYCVEFLGAQAWRSVPDALAFLNWAYHAPAMLSARGESLSLLNRSLYLSPSRAKEKKLFEEEFWAYARAPNPTLVAQLLEPIQGPRGEALPWKTPPFLGKYQHSMADLQKFTRLVDENPEFGNEDSSDCGDCETCGSFFACSTSTYDLEECVSCAECEIEGFCSAKSDDEDSPTPSRQ